MVSLISPALRIFSCLGFCLVFAGITVAEDFQIDPKQNAWHEKYKTQQNIPQLSETLLNTDPEPDVSEGFEPLFNGKDLNGWEPLGGTCTFEVKDEQIIGTCVPGSESTYLSTEKKDYADFVFTCDIKWDVDGNTGVMFRAQTKPGKEKKTGESRVVVFGPQAEMEGISGDRYWSGGIYGQSCGGYFYPLWLKQHQAARDALDRTGWNRITVEAKGDTVKTWVNGVPAAHWKGDGTYSSGFFGLQVHKGDKGTIRFKNIRVKTL